MYGVYILWYICTEGTVSQSIPENKTNLFGTASVTKLTTYPVAEAEFLRDSRSYPPWTFFFLLLPLLSFVFLIPTYYVSPVEGLNSITGIIFFFPGASDIGTFIGFSAGLTVSIAI